MGGINVEILNMFLIAAQAVKLLDLPRFPPRPGTSIQGELKGGSGRNMLKIVGILPTHVTRLKRKSDRRIRLQTQDSQKGKENEKAQAITEEY